MALPSVKKPKSGSPHNSGLLNFCRCLCIVHESGASHPAGTIHCRPRWATPSQAFYVSPRLGILFLRLNLSLKQVQEEERP
jgi:hypothetical protein